MLRFCLSVFQKACCQRKEMIFMPKKRYAFLLSSLLVLSNVTPVFASDSDTEQDANSAIEAIEEKMNAIKKNSGLSQESVNETFSDTQSQFSSLTDQYNQLSSKYGQVNTANAGEYYLDYLENLQDSNDQTQYNTKLEAIADSDISINDATLSSTYSKLKKTVQKNLKSAGVNISSTTTSKNKKTAKNNSANRETLLSFSDASAKYEDLVSSYKSSLSDGSDTSSSVSSGYTTNAKSKLTSSLGKTISQSYYDGDNYTGNEFLSTSTLYNRINSNAAYVLSGSSDTLSDDSSSSSSDSSSSKTYSSISSGIK